MREVRSKPGMPVWRKSENDRPISLMITRAGRAAIGVGESGPVEDRGEIHVGEHHPGPGPFDAAQARMKEQAVERSAIRSSTPALLAGRIFDDRKNPMTPTHANKKGIRYRYYVSHALLQGRANEAGSVARISAPDVEAVITDRLRAESDAENDASDREIIDNHLVQAIVGRDQITITPRLDTSVDGANDQSDGPTISVPFKAALPLRKGISHSPSGPRTIDEVTRSALLTAIAR
jgi:site-specific DNA recombinase